ncbi:MAG: FecR family protein [Mucilaginibacter sp.]|uniref:FecR family protein n=1 Tax=Mucilaginibacter sp. TaxID=1882438 RepID=UPI00326758EA
MSEERLYHLLVCFAENNIDRDDYDELMALIKLAETDTALFAAMDKIWKSTSNEPLFIESGEVYNHILNDPRFTASNSQPVIKPFFRINRLGLVACFFLFCGLAISGYYFISQLNKTQKISYTEYAVQSGHRAQIKFPDGTVVDMNGDSKLRYPSTFTGKTREIYLEGEAYFDVAHDATRPFIVHTATVNTQVLGTAFNISAYKGEKISVAVERGKVSVVEGNSKLGVLTPDHKLDYDLNTKHVNEYTIDVHDIISWKNGDLVFKNVTIIEAVSIMNRWYGTKITIGSYHHKNNRFSASFLKKESLQKVLAVLSDLNGFKYTFKSNEVIIKQYQ